MTRRPHHLSIFAQSLDRQAFVAYFLGAIVPLAALALAAHRYVIPGIQDRSTAIWLVAGLVSISLLSLAAFLALRRATNQALDRSRQDNRQLQSLLEAAGTLSKVGDRVEAARTLAGSARRLCPSRRAHVLAFDEKRAQLETLARADEGGELPEAVARQLEPLAKLAMEEGRPLLRGTSDGGSCPAAILPIGSASQSAGAMIVIREVGAPSFTPAEVDSLQTLASLGAVAMQNADLRDAQRNFFVYVTDLLVNALDSLHQGHARRVAHIANRVGRELEIGDAQLERLHFASLLHDIGVLKIPVDQRRHEQVMARHPVLGYRMLHSIQLWEDVAPFVLYHHECWDGAGYPEGLSGEDIPREARIIGLAEEVESLRGAGASVDEVLRAVEVGSGRQFDPEVARAFLDLMARGQIELED
jgi:HD-GYP domain-containing protein (c-di-GMP phosphodiesterase class II)